MPTPDKHRHPILVSACLMGVACRYDGQSKPNADILELGQRVMLVPYCPETRGGLKTPRPASERQSDGRFLTEDGKDVTDAYEKGANDAVTLCRDFQIDTAILKSRSPACGPYATYDGSFTHTLVDQAGIMAQALIDNGVTVFSDEEMPAVMAHLNQTT